MHRGFPPSDLRIHHKDNVTRDTRGSRRKYYLVAIPGRSRPAPFQKEIAMFASWPRLRGWFVQEIIWGYLRGFFRSLHQVSRVALCILLMLLVGESALGQGINQFSFSEETSGQISADLTVAARILGPQWKQMSRRAGLIFVGTVLSSSPPSPSGDPLIPTPATIPPAGPTIQLSFNVDRAIAGVETGQVLTIHEWAGASSMHRAMRPGQHFLLFLYPPSRLGFSSPVGGEAGEVLLDGSGQNVAAAKLAPPFKALAAPDPPAPIPSASASSGAVSVNQMERAIRHARSSREK